ncbi:type I polyketide synthase [Rhodospirillum sp. A1_3_36]|uniref:type I polyketide synthase n=1 Tax=Rhodospirillum sp. A1_3_36 TaxID=3391666 RepID=UPI0039A62362
MSAGKTAPGNRDLMRQALLRIDALQAKLRAAEARECEPIAIVGIGCRFPGGADTPDAYWELLRVGRDAIAEVPRDRWDIDAYYDPDPDAPGKMVQRHGAFLSGIDRFDPQFFGISPREAASMDPQQRLLLEVAWEALEDANIPADSLYRSATGVFIGMMGQDFGQRLFAPSRHDRIDAYAGTGTSPGMIAGRLSYCLGLTGPCFALDTACSSSLVALHLACDSLRRNECAMALTGGVNLILEPGLSINFSKARMLAPDGRCKTFDATADGYVRGEGCGVLVLKRLSDARLDGDRVLAVVRGSAVNQDGPSGGLTVPSGPAQEQVIRRALSNAGLEPDAVSYVEAHGTGTALGDPIELGALDRVFGTGHSADRPLHVGSVKTNLGHLEAAAGVAGVIKVVLALRHSCLPPHLNVTQPTPRFPWAEKPVRVARQAVDWPGGAEPRVAGISSFGFSGTNAHIVIADAPPGDDAFEATQDVGPRLLPLGAHTTEALTALAARYRDHLRANPGVAPGDLCASAALGRAHPPRRLAVMADDTAHMAEALDRFTEGRTSPDLIAPALESATVPSLAFLFTGQGSQYAGMGRRLYETEPVFRGALDRCAAILKTHADIDLIDLVCSDESGRLDRTGNTQPALFGLEYALAELWRSVGAWPDAVLGHSVGEYVAACVAGVFSLEDGLRLIATRARLMEALPESGAMASVAAPAKRVAQALTDRPTLSIAALNGPDQTVVSGDAAALHALLADLRAEGVASRELTVSHAFHSALMEPMLADFAAVAETVAFYPPTLPLISNLTGRTAGAEIASPDYWVRHVREAVQFADGVTALANLGCRAFVEIGPDPVLCGLARQSLPEDTILVPSLRRTDADRFPRALGELYVQGVAIDWSAVHHGRKTRPVALPTYPFQRKRYWFDDGLSAPVHRLPTVSDTLLRDLAASGELTAEELALAPKLLALLTHRRGAGDEADIGYRLAWRDRPRAAAIPAEGGAWLVIGADALAGDLRGAKRRCIDLPTLPDDETEVRRAIEAATTDGPLDGVLVAWPPGDDGLAAGEAALLAVTRLVRVLVELERPPRLWLMTEEATDAGGLIPRSPWPGLLWGLGRTLFLEHPALKGGLLDVAALADASDRAALLREVLAPDGEDAIALRGDARFVARLERDEAPPESPPPIRLDPKGAYLVTGGLGALGLRVAGLLADRGAGALVLIGRRGAAAVPTERLAALQAKGTRVEIEAADCADEVAMRAVLARIDASGLKLKGIVHAAGTATPTSLADLTPEILHDGLTAKVEGAWLLHRLTSDHAPDFAVFFSSVSAVLGTARQGVYTAANAFLDALATYRQGLGLPTLSIGWGPWGGGNGMADGDAERLIADSGFHPLEPKHAVERLGRLLGTASGTTLLVDADWARLKAVYEARGHQPLLEELGGAAISDMAVTKAERDRLDALPAGERVGALVAFLQDAIRAVLLFDADAPVDPRQGFFDMGLDSLTAAELKRRIDGRFGCALPSSAVFDHPNIATLAAHLLTLLVPEGAAEAPATPSPASPAATAPAVTDVQHYSDSDIAAFIDDELAALMKEG